MPQTLISKADHPLSLFSLKDKSAHSILLSRKKKSTKNPKV